MLAVVFNIPFSFPHFINLEADDFDLFMILATVRFEILNFSFSPIFFLVRNLRFNLAKLFTRNPFVLSLLSAFMNSKASCLNLISINLSLFTMALYPSLSKILNGKTILFVYSGVLSITRIFSNTILLPLMRTHPKALSVGIHLFSTETLIPDFREILLYVALKIHEFEKSDFSFINTANSVNLSSSTIDCKKTVFMEA